MSPARITLLVEDLSHLAAALPAGDRFPSMERILARGAAHRISADSANHLRYRLFGLELSKHLPVAALTRIAVTNSVPEPGPYWLRADPVTLKADMTRVFMTGAGYAGFDTHEREEVSGIIREVFAREGLAAGEAGPPWCFPLERALDFEFLPLHEALGLDAAEALPANESARTWKRVMTDIQVELHQCGTNRRRRETGQAEINSVWFWGGGAMPERFSGAFDTVVGDDPVSRGLGLLSDCDVYPPENWQPGEGRLLIDWVMKSGDALQEARALEQVAARLLEVSSRSGREFDLLDGSGAAWRYDSGARYRFWKRPLPLAASVTPAAS